MQGGGRGLKHNASRLLVIHEGMGFEWLMQDPRVSCELELTEGPELTLEDSWEHEPWVEVRYKNM